jgi:four helix bundle protein
MEIANTKMQNFREEISERLLNFAVDIIKLAVKLNKTVVGRHIGKQITRSGTSSGANYEEACGAESKADFAHKLQIVLKELKETIFWLRVVDRAKLLPNETEYIVKSLNEGKELSNIIAKSIITVKRN